MGLGLRGQRVKGLGHSIGQTITVSYGVRAWSCSHLVKSAKSLHANTLNNYVGPTM